MLKLGKSLLNQKGQTMWLMLMVLVAVMGIGVSAILGSTDSIQKQMVADREVKMIDRYARALESIVNNPVTCFGTITNGTDSLPRVNSGETPDLSKDFSGIKFADSGTYNMDKLKVAMAPNDQQEVEIGTSILQPGLVYFQAAKDRVDVTSGVGIKRLYITNRTDGPLLNSHVVDLYLEASIVSNPTRSFAPRLISRMTLKVDLTGKLVGCSGNVPAKVLCESMGCKYLSTTGQKCFCGFPDMDCNSSAAVTDGRKYIAGYDVANATPICKSVKLSCYDEKGPGYFFAGVDSAGHPICLAVETVTASTTTTTTSTTTTTVMSGPLGTCNCTFGGSDGICETMGMPYQVSWPNVDAGYCDWGTRTAQSGMAGAGSYCSCNWTPN